MAIQVEELLDRPRILRVLLALGRHEPLNFRQFTEASGHGRPYAQVLRQEMVDLDYIVERRLPGHGHAGILEIRLTPFGRNVAELLLALDDLVAAKRRGG